MPADNNVTMEDVRIIFRNFTGREGQYNREGDRNFAVLLDEDTATAMFKDGWNVKRLKPKEEDDVPEGQPYLQVTVNFKNKPPLVAMITSRGRTILQEEQVEILDWADIAAVDLIVHPYAWSVGDKSGIKAYLKSLFITINEDELELKYADLNDVPSRSGRTNE